MSKRHTFWIERSYGPNVAVVRFLNKVSVCDLCYPAFARKYSIKLKRGEEKKIAITIEEVK